MSNEADLELHQRLLDGDAVAPEEVAERYLFSLQQYLQSKHLRVDKDSTLDAAATAILNYVKNPQSYKPELRSLFGFLKMAAEGDFINLLNRQKRYNMRVVALENVAVGDMAGNINIEEEFISREDLTLRLKAAQDLRSEIALNEQDRQLLALMQAKIRTTADYAKVLGISDEPLEIQRETVKRHKDRLRLRQKRLAQKEAGR